MNYEHDLLQNDCTIRNHSSPEVDLLLQTMKLCGNQVTVVAASDPVSEFDHNDKIITGMRSCLIVTLIHGYETL